MTNQFKSPSNVSAASSDKQHGAKILFWYFSLFWTMGVTAFATGAVWFQVINKFLPQEISYSVGRAFNQSAVKGAIAAIIVGAPAFFLFAWLIRRAIGRNEIPLRKGARQWVGYLILFIVVATALGDIITTVLTWLNGDFTTRFLLKSLIILAITGWTFTYFWLSLRSEDGLKTSKFPQVAVIVSVVIIAISLVIGFTMVDSPAVARIKAYDQSRVNDLENIRWAVENYYSSYQKLPDDLNALKNIQAIPVDPKSGQAYTYEVINKKEYKLCAVFETDNKTQAAQNDASKPVYTDETYQPFWHTTGKNCFSLTTPQVNQLQKPLPVPIQ